MLNAFKMYLSDVFFLQTNSCISTIVPKKLIRQVHSYVGGSMLISAPFLIGESRRKREKKEQNQHR